MTARKRNHAVDVLRAIGIIVMILAHIEIGPWFYKWSHAFHMPLFFLVSGYFFNELAATEHTADYIKKKAQGLLMPYMAVAFVCYVLWSLLKHDRPLIEPLLNIFLLNQSGIPIATAIWFLTCLFMLECTYIGITKLIRYKMGRYFAIALMAGFSIVWSSLVKKELPYSLLPALGGVPFFALGHLLCKEQLMRAEILDRVPMWVYIVALGAMSWLVEQNVAVNLRGNKYGNIALFYINAVGITLLLWGVSEKYVHFAGGTRLCAYLESIGKESLVYLCTNQALITIAEMSIGNILPVGTFGFKIITFIFVMLMGGVCISCMNFLRKVRNSVNGE